MKSGRRNVMFIHQTLSDGASTASEAYGSTKKRGRPKKMKLTDHPHQTIVTTPATSSSVIKDATTVVNNSSGDVEEVCTSPTPLQIDLSPSVVNNNNEQNNTEMIVNEPLPEDSDTAVDRTALDNGHPPVPSLPPIITTKRPRIRRSSTTGKASFGVQTKATETGEKTVEVSFKYHLAIAVSIFLNIHIRCICVHVCIYKCIMCLDV